jgi:hypothetical protein
MTPTNEGSTIAPVVRALWSRAAFKQNVQLLSEGVTNLVYINEHQLILLLARSRVSRRAS